ncbi:MAG: cation transporter dimerization domain-containing protein, partial [Candidatus Thermoplasmatota archaeon]|nr:cation transporter dimerization domain-containing protein [Candidatus Thermoplasmatota archaeon]
RTKIDLILDTKPTHLTQTQTSMGKVILNFPDYGNVATLEARAKYGCLVAWVIQTDRGSLLEMHVCVDKTMNVEQSHRLEHRLVKLVRKCHPSYDVKIHTEPKEK